MMVPGYKGPANDMIGRPAQPKPRMISPGGPKLMPPPGGGFATPPGPKLLPPPGGGFATPPGPGNLPRPMPRNTGPMKPPMAPPVVKPVPGMRTPPGPGNLPPRGGVSTIPPMPRGGITPPGPGNAPRPMPRNPGPMKPPMKPPVAKPVPGMQTPPGPGNLPPGGGMMDSRGPGQGNLPPMMDNGGVSSHGPGSGAPDFLPFDGGNQGGAVYDQLMGGGGMSYNPESGMAEAGGLPPDIMQILLNRKMNGGFY